MVATGVIQDAPPIPAKPWEQQEVFLTHEPIEVRSTTVYLETPQPTPTPFIAKQSADAQSTATFNIMFGVVSSLLISSGDEVESVLAEQGRVTVHCEFCGQRYEFAPDAARAFFADATRH